MHSPYVTTLPQTYLTEAQKAQARENIDVQKALTAGSNIQINGSTISATDTKYTAGSNVQISQQNVISATDTKYTAGNGLNLNGTEFSADTTVLQPKLTAGDNVQINNNVISATDTKYTAGSNVQINSSNVISATDTKYTAGTNVQINSSNVISATDTKYTAGSNVQISNSNVISATDTTYSAGTNISIDANNVISAASQVQSDWTQSDNTKVDFIKHKPNLATVATSGNYADLSNKPSIPTVNDGDLKLQLGTSAAATKVFSANQSGESTIVVPNRTYTVNGSTTTYSAGLTTLEDMQAIYSQSDWAQTDNTKVDFIKNKPSLPTVNDGTLTITQGSTTLGSFTANQSSNSNIAIPEPPHVPVQYYHAVNYVPFSITSTTSYSTYQYNYPAALDRTKDYIATFYINLSQPTNETWSLGNADVPFHFHVDTTGSFSVIDATGVMTNLGGGHLYESSFEFTVKIPMTYMLGNANLNFLLYLQPNTLTTSNTVELSYKVYYQEYIV